ncbi:MAG TPA: reverse transcriptase-like protein [Pyrinomonadaceae bacterium]|jgi:ribonuclease HI
MANIGRIVSNAQQNITGSKLTIYCNGRFNYHQAGLGVWAFIVKDRKGSIRAEGCGFCDNRIDVSHIDAEYRAVIEGLHWAIANAKGASVEVCTSLELIEKQVSGSWKVKKVKLLPLCNEIKTLLEKANATLRWIPIHQNRLAHLLSLGANCIEREGVAAAL